MREAGLSAIIVAVIVALLLVLVSNQQLLNLGGSAVDGDLMVELISPVEGDWVESTLTVEVETTGYAQDTTLVLVINGEIKGSDTASGTEHTFEVDLNRYDDGSGAPVELEIFARAEGVTSRTATVTALYPRQMTDDTAEDIQPEWNSIGDMLVFKSARGLEIGLFEIYTIPREGGTPTQIPTEREYHGYPHLSPTGTHVVFNSWVYSDDGSRQMDIFTADVESGETIQVTADPAFDDSGRWSPDGNSIIFYSKRDGTMDLWKVTVNAIGEPAGSPEKLVGTPAREHCGRWSFDGEMIVYESDEGGNNDLWLVGANGGETTKITFDEYPDGYPGWAPDGAHIVYNSIREENGDLWILSLENGAMQRLTSHAAMDAHPTWSADGRFIAFHSDRAGNSDIWVVEVPPLDGVAGFSTMAVSSAFGGFSSGSLALVAIAAGMLFGKVEWVRRSE